MSDRKAKTLIAGVALIALGALFLAVNLTNLQIDNTQVFDLAPLAGSSLTTLNCDRSPSASAKAYPPPARAPAPPVRNPVPMTVFPCPREPIGIMDAPAPSDTKEVTGCFSRASAISLFLWSDRRS